MPTLREKISNKQTKCTPQGIRKRRAIETQVNRRKEIIKIRAEINDRDQKDNRKINELFF